MFDPCCDSHTIISVGQLNCFDLSWVTVEEELLQGTFEGEMLALRVILRMTMLRTHPIKSRLKFWGVIMMAE